jgi:cbb3-type cytochrome oxidase maturation protein
MPLGLWVLVGWMVLMPLIGLALFLWGLKTGQFHNIEEAKYRVLEDREPEPWPDRKGG